MAKLPQISVIIPSYNQGEFLEQAILSLLEQNYSDLDLIVIDGGSTDNSVEILRGYDRNLSYWVSEKDRGQTHALNKGLERSTGAVWSYLNSDDLLEPCALHAIGRAFASDPGLDWLAGGARVFGQGIGEWPLIARGWNRNLHVLTPWDRPEKYVFPCSVACFMSRRLLSQCGPFDESYHFCMDIEYYVRAALKFGFRQQVTDQLLGAWRWHAASKSWNAGCAYGFREEEIRIAESYAELLDADERATLKNQLRFQRKVMVPRKAMWLLSQGRRNAALSHLTRGALKSPSLFCNRPWLGAIRRALCSSRPQPTSK